MNLGRVCSAVDRHMKKGGSPLAALNDHRNGIRFAYFLRNLLANRASPEPKSSMLPGSGVCEMNQAL